MAEVDPPTVFMMTDDDDELQYFAERAHLQMDPSHLQFDYAWLVLVSMITAVSVVCWLCVLAYSVVIPTLIGVNVREKCITPRNRHLLLGSHAGTQTDISMKTEKSWRTYLKEHNYLRRMAKCMALAKMVDSQKAKKELQRKDETDNSNNGNKNETENTHLKYVLLENKEVLTDRIMSLEKKLFETQSRNDGLRNSLEHVEHKRCDSQKDVEIYWQSWQTTQSLLSQAKKELSIVRQRLRQNDVCGITHDDSGEAAASLLVASCDDTSSISS